MGPKDVLRIGIKGSNTILTTYVSDLSDEELLVRAVPTMNHTAWQLGHLIGGASKFLNLIQPGSAPTLPEEFLEAHGKANAGSDDPSRFCTKAKYLELWAAQLEATLNLLEVFPEDRLDETNPEKFPPFAPTPAALFNLFGAHAIIHGGQIVAVRRKLGKPVLM